MIQKLAISGVHMDVDNDLHKYVLRKIGKLDKYMPKHARQSAHAEIKLKERNAKGKQERTAEVIVHLPKEVIAVKETTINMFAAIDIAEEKLKTRLRKYKDLHAAPRLHRRVLTRFRRSEASA